jgi:hypothetical protein
MKRLKLSIVGLALLAWASEAGAALSINQYLEFEKTEPKLLEFYLSRLLTGYGFSNTELDKRKQPKLYCQPGNLAITVDNIKQLVADEIKNETSVGKAMIGLLDVKVLRILQKAFPCKE